MKYSIVYIETRPEIHERLSVGLIVMSEGNAIVRTSVKKLKAAEFLLSGKEYKFVSRTLADMKNSVKTEKMVNYLTRYSNNLITVSPLQTIEIDNSEKNWDWLYRNYVYDKSKGNVA